MATFKVGQRVKVIAVDGLKWSFLVGCTGTIIPVPPVPPLSRQAKDFPVDLDGLPCPLPSGTWGFNADQLAPLTDPKAEAFIEGLKKLAREPAPLERHAVGDKS
jgi:hypothetical protein